MNDERDSDVQDWFKRSVDALPGQPFAWEVLAKVRRREQKLRLQGYAAWFMAAFSFVLLLPRLIVLLERLAALPLAVVDVGDQQWPVIVPIMMGLGWWLLRRARNSGLP